MKHVTMLTKEGFLLLSTYVDIMQQLKCWTSTCICGQYATSSAFIVE